MDVKPQPLKPGPLRILNNKLKPNRQKFCNSCGQIKPFEDFSGRGDKPGYTCKQCGRGYNKIHAALRKLHGPALDHVCYHCGFQAQQWAYNGQDPNDSGTGCNRWSEDLSFYIPLCQDCHRVLDGRAGRFPRLRRRFQ